jgi:hypothetical protein
MTDEPENIVLRLLQEIRADLAAMKTDHGQRFDKIDSDLANVKETLRLHGLRLDTYSENFHDIIGLLRDRATAADLRALAARVDALEGRRQ